MVSLITIVDLLVVLSFVVALSAFRDYRQRGGLRYPPGPRPLPVIGNLLDIPKESSWLAYAKFAKRYGGSSFCHLFRLKRVLQGMFCPSTCLAKSLSS